MENPRLKLIIVARDQGARVQTAWSEIAEFLEGQPRTEIVTAAVTEDVDLARFDADLVVTIGGDGAILRACRQLGRRQLPILGVIEGAVAR